jgi:hypothetical protein
MLFGIKCMFEKLTVHGINSTECSEIACRPCLPKLTPLKKCESSLLETDLLFRLPALYIQVKYLQQ